MAEVDSSGVDISVDIKEHDTHTEYIFKNAKDFYNVLLDFDGVMNKNVWPYHPAVNGQIRWIFRGHWDSTWELTPAAFRKDDKDGKKWYEKFLFKPAETVLEILTIRRPKIIYLKNIKYKEIPKEFALKHQITMEYDLLERFMDIANFLGIECNYSPSLYEYYPIVKGDAQKNNTEELKEWPYSSILSLMVLAQHHGIPTRLLDFTYNPLFAAFFAAFEPFDKKLDKKSWDKNLCIWAIDERNMLVNLWQKIPITSNRSGNLFAQEGLLLLDHTANEKLSDNNEGWRNLQPKDKHFIKIALPQSECKELLRLLWENNITPARIKPNLDKVTQTLEYTQWLWTEKGYPPHHPAKNS